MSNTSFDTAGFYEALDAVRQARAVSWGHIFRATGVIACRAPAQLRKHTLTRENRQKLAAWAGIDASAYEQREGTALPPDDAAMKREYRTALREGGYYQCFPEQEGTL